MPNICCFFSYISLYIEFWGVLDCWLDKSSTHEDYIHNPSPYFPIRSFDLSWRPSTHVSNLLAAAEKSALSPFMQHRKAAKPKELMFWIDLGCVCVCVDIWMWWRFALMFPWCRATGPCCAAARLWCIIWNMCSSRCKELKEQSDLESRHSWRPVSATSVRQPRPSVCPVPFLPFLCSFLCASSYIYADKSKLTNVTHAEFKTKMNVCVNLDLPQRDKKEVKEERIKDTFDHFQLFVSNI